MAVKPTLTVLDNVAHTSRKVNERFVGVLVYRSHCLGAELDLFDWRSGKFVSVGYPQSVTSMRRS